jgi:outer membrane lipoprotein-sorting protein
MARIDIRARWAVPVGAVAVTGIVIAAATVASADSAPSLPSRTPAQLLTQVAQGTAKPLGPLTATVQQTSDLGLPELPSVGQEGGPSLGTSPETTSIWYRDPQHIRVAEQVPAGETDLRLDGSTLWVWNSKTQTATKYALPAHGSQAASDTGAKSVPELPQSAAVQLLKAIGPTTVVSVQRNLYVAGRAAYQLSLVPRSSQSLVGSVLIAIDASRHIPLRVEVLARGSSTVAYSIGFTALSFGTPAASNFSFTPPPGATVKNVAVPGNVKSILGPAGLSGLPFGGLPLGRTLIGSTVLPRHVVRLNSPPLRVVKTRNGKLVIVKTRNGKRVIVKRGTGKLVIGQLAPPSLPTRFRALPLPVRRQIEAQFAKGLPASMTKAQQAAAIKAFDQHFATGLPPAAIKAIRPHLINQKGNIGGGFIKPRAFAAGGGFGFPFGWTGYAPLTAGPPAGAPHVIGKSWLSVIATPPSPQVAAAVQQAIHGGPAGQPRTTVTYGSSASPSSATAYSSKLPPVGPALAVLQALLKATVPVHGSWGSGRLLQTTLLTVLVTSKGQILAGAVTPSALYADVAADAG